MIVSPIVIVAIVLAAIYFLMVMYFFVGWLKLKPAREGNSHTLPFVSVVVPVRNEADYLENCVESIFKQNYPAHLFEVILIDDYSTDTTLEIARGFKYENLTVLDLQQYLGNPGEYTPNKKKAIALGIKNAKGPFILTTDGDCAMGENWLQSMVAGYKAGDYKMVTGPVLIKPARNPFAWFQQLDVINLLGITGATIGNKQPLMCNGANLLYEKSTFLEVGGFKGNHEVPTGDDIFLMHKINARFPGSIGFVRNYEACVFSKAEKGFGNFIGQRKRWISKSTRFNDFKSTLMLLFAYAFNAGVIGSAILALMPGEMAWLPFAIIGGTKLFADLVFDIPVTWFFRKLILLLLLPIIEVFHILYVLIIGPLSLTGRYRWKDRKIR